jgi:hypothetical protein
VTVINLVQNLRTVLFAAIAAFVFLAGAGCQKGMPVTLHYTADSTTGRHATNLFFPAKIMVVPPELPRVLEIGSIFDAQGYRQARLQDPGIRQQIAAILVTGLENAGLKPILIDRPPAPGNFPIGVDFIITGELQQLYCIKRYLPAADIPGAFTMSANAQLELTVSGRAGTVYSGSAVSTLTEPVERIAPQKYKATILEPSEALSVALSQTVDKLLANPAFQRVLPRRSTASSATSSLTSIATASAAVSPASDLCRR